MPPVDERKGCLDDKLILVSHEIYREQLLINVQVPVWILLSDHVFDSLLAGLKVPGFFQVPVHTLQSRSGVTGRVSQLRLEKV